MINGYDRSKGNKVRKKESACQTKHRFARLTTYAVANKEHREAANIEGIANGSAERKPRMIVLAKAVRVIATLMPALKLRMATGRGSCGKTE